MIIPFFMHVYVSGWLTVRHIRTLEPGITNGQAWRVSGGWGCGAIVAALVMILIVGIASSALGL